MKRAVILVLMTASACRGKSDGGELATLFPGEGPLTRIELRLDRDALDALEKKPKEWVAGAVVHRGKIYEEVAIRIKGHRSRQKLDKKPAFKLDFKKYVKGRRFFGLKSLTLNNLVEDPTMMREALAYRIHAALGVDVPRWDYAELFLNGEYLGLYLMLEPVDEVFTARRGGEGDTIYEGEYGCDLYPGDAGGFDRDAGDGDSRDELVALAEVAQGPAAELLGRPRSPIDRDRLLAFLAAGVLIGDFDGYRQGHNYYLRHDIERGKWSLIPWGLDRSFQTPLGIYDHGGLLAVKCFGDRACREDYIRTLHRGVDELEKLELAAVMQTLEARIDHAATTDPRKPQTTVEMRQARRALARFLHYRPVQVKNQLGCYDGRNFLDRDGDGHACTDCDDGDPAIHPGAVELCDQRDNDCSGLVDDGAECSCPSVQAEGSTYYLCNLPMTWSDAQTFCAKQGLMLAKIESRKLSKLLYEATQAAAKMRWWIGLEDRAIEHNFRWTDGSTLTFAYWAKGEPDNYVCNQDCAVIADGGRGRWHDNHCAHRLPFLCEAPAHKR